MKGYRVLVVYGLFVDKVPVVVVEVHGRDPLLLCPDDPPPHASEAMQVDNQKEDQLVQLQKGFELFG